MDSSYKPFLRVVNRVIEPKSNKTANLHEQLSGPHVFGNTTVSDHCMTSGTYRGILVSISRNLSKRRNVQSDEKYKSRSGLRYGQSRPARHQVILISFELGDLNNPASCIICQTWIIDSKPCRLRIFRYRPLKNGRFTNPFFVLPAELISP
jgi:hypothetical protein